MDRRGFLRGLIAAPAVVAFGSLMPVRGIIMPIEPDVWVRVHYRMIGWREDLSDLIYRIEPTKTPFLAKLSEQ